MQTMRINLAACRLSEGILYWKCIFHQHSNARLQTAQNEPQRIVARPDKLVDLIKENRFRTCNCLYFNLKDIYLSLLVHVLFICRYHSFIWTLPDHPFCLSWAGFSCQKRARDREWETDLDGEVGTRNYFYTASYTTQSLLSHATTHGGCQNV